MATLDCRLLYEPVSLPSKTNSGIYYTMHGPKKVTKCFSFRLPHTILVILRCQNIFSSKILCYSEFQNSVMFYLRQLSLATLDCRLLYEPVSLQCKTNLGIYYRKAPKKSPFAIYHSCNLEVPKFLFLLRFFRSKIPRIGKAYICRTGMNPTFTWTMPNKSIPGLPITSNFKNLFH